MIEKIYLENLGTVNKNKVSFELTNGSWIELYFSYKTLVGIKQNGRIVCLENYWSTTTGKLLNEIEPDKTKRLAQEDFDKVFNEIIRAINK